MFKNLYSDWKKKKTNRYSKRFSFNALHVYVGFPRRLGLKSQTYEMLWTVAYPCRFYLQHWDQNAAFLPLTFKDICCKLPQSPPSTKILNTDKSVQQTKHWNSLKLLKAMGPLRHVLLKTEYHKTYRIHIILGRTPSWQIRALESIVRLTLTGL